MVAPLVHPRFDAEGLRTACARLRRGGEIDPVQLRADAQTLIRELDDLLFWLQGCARREAIRQMSVAVIPEDSGFKHLSAPFNLGLFDETVMREAVIPSVRRFRLTEVDDD